MAPENASSRRGSVMARTIVKMEVTKIIGQVVKLLYFTQALNERRNTQFSQFSFNRQCLFVYLSQMAVRPLDAQKGISRAYSHSNGKIRCTLSVQRNMMKIIEHGAQRRSTMKVFISEDKEIGDTVDHGVFMRMTVITKNSFYI